MKKLKIAVIGQLFKLLIGLLFPFILSSCFFNANIKSMDQGKFTSERPSDEGDSSLSSVKLVFIKQPVGHVAPLTLLSQQPVLEIQDAQGNKIITGSLATAKIKLSLSSGTGVLNGTLTANATAGRLEITDLMLDQEGADKKITATLDLDMLEMKTIASTSQISVVSDVFVISSVTAPTNVYTTYTRSLDRDPQVTVEGVTPGDQVMLYSDNCQTLITSVVATGTEEYFYLTNLNPGSYTFYAKRIDASSKSSPCNLVGSNYLIPDTVNFANDQFMDRVMEGIGIKSVNLVLSQAQATDLTVYYNHSGSTALNNQVTKTDGFVVIPAGSTTATLSYVINSDVSSSGETKLVINIEGTDSDKVTGGKLSQAVILIKDPQTVGTKMAVSITSGSDHICALDNNQKLYCWGYNFFGQVGVGALYDLYRTPQAVTPAVNYSYVESFGARTCAITSAAGALYCWGSNTPNPTLIDSGVSYKMVSPGNGVTCGITSTDALKCWGSNSSGQVGNGTTSNQATPLVIDSGVSYKYVNAGSSSGSVCAITMAGLLKCWGSNYSGVLGDGTTTDSLLPKPIDAGNQYVKVALGIGFGCGLDSTSKVRCWGSGFIGNNTYAMNTVPVIIDAAESYIDLTVQSSACAVTNLGIIKCWGDNSSGQLGIGNSVSSSMFPVDVASGEVFNKVVTGNAFSCGRTTGGSIVCWGSNAYGQFGTGSAFKNRLPELLNVSETVQRVFSGGQNTCYINSSNKLKCMTIVGMGGNVSGEGLNLDRASYVRIDSTESYRYLSSSYSSYDYQTCGITVNNDLKCWGLNGGGELGNGNTDYRNHQTPEISDSGTKYQKISVGSTSVCGITTGQQLRCWGQNFFGEVGNGNTLPQTTPYVVESGTNYIDVSIGLRTTCAITSSNVLKCWGNNSNYQLGVGNNTNSSLPLIVDSGVGYKKVVVGGGYGCGILTTGRVKCWGYNGYGQLGDGSTSTRTTPVLINDASSYLDISTGGDFNCGITDTNVLKCWGRNFSAQLGNGDALDQSSPVVISSGVQFDSVSASSQSTCAKELISQKYRCWGIDPIGTLGLKHPLRSYPVNYAKGFEN